MTKEMQVAEYNLSRITGLQSTRNDIKGSDFFGGRMIQVLRSADKSGFYRSGSDVGQINEVFYSSSLPNDGLSISYADFVKFGKPTTIRKTLEVTQTLEDLSSKSPETASR